MLTRELPLNRQALAAGGPSPADRGRWPSTHSRVLIDSIAAAVGDLDMATTEENQYFRPGVGFLLFLAVVFVLSQLAGLAAIYVGDEYTSPSWSEHSVPLPRMY